MTYVPYDPSLETPDEGRTNGRLTGIQSVGEFTECSSIGEISPMGDIRFQSLQPWSARDAPAYCAEAGSLTSHVCCQIAAKTDRVHFIMTSKGTLTRTFVVAGGGFEPPTSGL
jgi:hypothetical protein